MMHENEGHATIDIHITNPDSMVEGASEKKVTTFAITRGIPNQQNIPSSHQDSRVEGAPYKKVAPKKKMAPEKKVTTFAITMSALDLMAIVLGMLKLYLVVRKIDLGAMIKSITVHTLILEGIRILCRGRGLELYHMHNMKQLPLSISIIGQLFYWLHLISVLFSGVVSALELATLDFVKTDAALVFFYVVTILEALVFLATMAIWIWEVSHGRLFETVQDECGLGKLDFDMDPIRRFFYDAYYKCVTGNIFDVVKMDLVTFAEEILNKTSSEEQFMGARILEALLSTHADLSDATVGKILTSKDSKVIERLIKILIWKNSFNGEVRYLAAVIVTKLVEEEPDMNVAGMKKAMESANDLLSHKYY